MATVLKISRLQRVVSEQPLPCQLARVENNKDDVIAGRRGRIVEGRLWEWGQGEERSGGVVEEKWGINITWQLLLLGKKRGLPFLLPSLVSFPHRGGRPPDVHAHTHTPTHCVTISLFNPGSEEKMEGSWTCVGDDPVKLPH